ncbi:MAG: DUF255 domain-containing protein [Bacteroidota bacterium]
MKKILCFFLICISLVSVAQNEKGIRFEHKLSWEEVKAKAKAESKYIFMDCFATWCTPCKYMDKEVYPKDTVGDYMNAKFISVKVQMDSAGMDNEEIKNWYGDAKTIRLLYKVTGLPTFLYFSPEGKILHRGVGSYKYTEFLGLSANAANPEKQYYTLLENYKAGEKDYGKMAYLADKARSLDDKETADRISKDYMNNYLFKLPEDTLFTKENIEFIGSFTQNSKDKGFKLFYLQADGVNGIMNNKYYSRSRVDLLIDKEFVSPILIKAINSKNTLPDWDKMIKKIKKRFTNEIADRIVINAQEKYYANNNNLPELYKIYIKRYRKYGISSSETEYGSVDGVTNNMAWAIFENSQERTTINVAIEWEKKIIDNTNLPPNDILKAVLIDTYANLLYKVGRTSEAIEWETKSLNIANDLGHKDAIYAYQNVLDSMNKGTPTWPTRN